MQGITGVPSVQVIGDEIACAAGRDAGRRQLARPAGDARPHKCGGLAVSVGSGVAIQDLNVACGYRSGATPARREHDTVGARSG